MHPISSFGVVAFSQCEHLDEVIGRLCAWSATENIPLILHPFFRGMVPDGVTIAESEAGLLAASEAVISVGGDGTFLSVAHLCRFTHKPVIGINLGGLGFLTDIGRENIEESLQKIRQGRYAILSRMVLEACIKRGNDCVCAYNALNDIFIKPDERTEIDFDFRVVRQ